MQARYRKAQSRKLRSSLIHEAMAMTNLSQKYVINLLNGRVFHRRRKGRRKTYSPEARKTLPKIWSKLGHPCTLYLHARIKESIQDYIEDSKRKIPQPVIDEMLRMSPATMERIIKPHRLGVRYRNKRSGLAALQHQIPAGPSSPEPRFEPGHLDIDTVALCGGDLRGDFFWVLVVTDVATQWTDYCPCWNKSAWAITQALEHILKRLPFKVLSIHSDNGSEFFNKILERFLAEQYPNLKRTRSRPYCKNDNCRVEQKNCSQVRDLVGDLRFDDPTQYEALFDLFKDWAALHNFSTVCRKLISKTLKPGSLTAYDKHYDTPKTPAERLAEIIPLPPHEHINAITLRRSCEKRLDQLYRTQHLPPAAKG